MRLLGAFLSLMMFGMCASPVLAIDDFPPDDEFPEDELPEDDFPIDDEPEFCEIEDINTIIIDKLIESTGCECEDDAGVYERCLKKKTKRAPVTAFLKAAARAKFAEAGLKAELKAAIADEVQACEDALLDEDLDDE